ncbi:MAG: PH domain-containing protein [Cyclobacteriaceae bacterium]|jgi:hypothetical protein
MKEQAYSAKLDSSAKTISLIVLLLVSILTVFVVLVGIQIPEDFMEIFSATLGLWILVGLYYSRSVRGYLINERELVIKKIFSPYRIPFDSILKISLLKETDFRDLKRLTGSAGLFGYDGLYRDNAFGEMKWQATQKKNFILLQLKSGFKVVVTPDDPGLADLLQSALKK